ncbi:glycoside hydrolase family 13 protein [Clostridium folliculivorans]|uniref:Oligo-1,6-glucosidase n=1 Tax=Clostridium folliculivorans TaxID=2886038 RepID=A0A9W5Y335_9CLOT|nr:alpha-glucosidase [Clostridium folliculivorans]GKU25658.1 oligo-1,6-glucosidase [Clostridium folliculivorans]GKU28680.1 oligo-1,6-glucosidase [Clostridium folliculivorans]
MERKWWKEGVVYQLYPRSFKDSNGDGIGDLRGVIEKLDYLKELGINIMWLNPVYKSPNDDMGYDISDYRDIMDEFGTMEDFKELLKGLHERDIKLVMDLVVNHSSDEHKWFAESRSSKDSKYRDYYIWRKGKNGQPPNNWGSCFSGSAWQYDETTEEYYLHLFSKKQPDLNWENSEVRKEVYDMMKYWFEMGVDGFRMDVINFISKVPELPDGPKGEDDLYGNFAPYSMNGPRIHEFMQEMYKEVLSKYDVMTVGECPGVSPELAKDYVGKDRNELNMIFQFELMDIGKGRTKWEEKPWTLGEFKAIMSKWQEELSDDGWNSLYLNNHDQPRMVSRFGNDKEYRVESAKMLATMLHTMHGTPYIYQGEEIGMTNVKYTSVNEYKDLEILNAYKELVEGGLMKEEDFMAGVYRMGRDNARTPIQWDNSLNGGFSNGTPWLKVNPNYTEINVEEALKDNNSIFYYYKRLIQLRKENDVIVYGTFKEYYKESETIYCYTRQLEDKKILVVLNFFEEEVELLVPEELRNLSRDVLITNYDNVPQEDHFKLRPYEAIVYKLYN